MNNKEAIIKRVAITANSACISAEEAGKYGVTIIPFHTIIDGKDYLDPEVDMESLYATLDKDVSDDGAKCESDSQCILEMSASTDRTMNIFAKVGSRAEGIEKLIEIVRERNKGGNLHIGINYVNDTYSEAKELKRRLLSQSQRNEVHLTQDSLFPVIYSGPGAIKLGQYSDE